MHDSNTRGLLSRSNAIKQRDSPRTQNGRQPPIPSAARPKFRRKRPDDEALTALKVGGCRRINCPLIAGGSARCRPRDLFADISTVRCQPQRLWEWAAIAMEVAQEYSG
jgi:hypothetical protein